MTEPQLLAAPSWRLLLLLALVRLGLYGLSSGPLAYGHMTDELYYLDCANHLAWGYVDHPPLSVAILAIVRATLGDSLLALHLLPVLAHCLTIFLVALLARELSGGATAQGLAALAALIAPVYLAVSDFYSMNAFEPALWAGAALLMARLTRGADRRLWLVLGVVLGVALLNKISTLWFALGLFVGLVLTPQRRWLATRWPWLAAAVAAGLFAPHVVWQVQYDWPTLEFMHNATTEKMVTKSPLTFLAEQLLTMNPVTVPFWLSGLLFYFSTAEGRRQQVLGWVWITVFALLLLSGTARSNYLAPAYVVLVAAGGVAFERLARRPTWGWLPGVTAAVFIVGGALVAPMAVSLVPPARFAAYERALGVSPPVDQKDELGSLPLHFALRFGTREIVDAVARVYATLSPDERREAVILGSSFGVTAALNFFGPQLGLPHAVGGHNNYWLWGPGDASGHVLIAVAGTDEQLKAWYDEVERVADVRCIYCLPEVARLGIYACHKPRRPLREWWPEAKKYV